MWSARYSNEAFFGKKFATHAGQGREIFIPHANVKEKQRGVAEVE